MDSLVNINSEIINLNHVAHAVLVEKKEDVKRYDYSFDHAPLPMLQLELSYDSGSEEFSAYPRVMRFYGDAANRLWKHLLHRCSTRIEADESWRDQPPAPMPPPVAASASVDEIPF
jgi:hypothetical protein